MREFVGGDLARVDRLILYGKGFDEVGAAGRRSLRRAVAWEPGRPALRVPLHPLRPDDPSCAGPSSAVFSPSSPPTASASSAGSSPCSSRPLTSSTRSPGPSVRSDNPAASGAIPAAEPSAPPSRSDKDLPNPPAAEPNSEIRRQRGSRGRRCCRRCGYFGDRRRGLRCSRFRRRRQGHLLPAACGGDQACGTTAIPATPPTAGTSGAKVSAAALPIAGVRDTGVTAPKALGISNRIGCGGGDRRIIGSDNIIGGSLQCRGELSAHHGIDERGDLLVDDLARDGPVATAAQHRIATAHKCHARPASRSPRLKTAATLCSTAVSSSRSIANAAAAR